MAGKRSVESQLSKWLETQGYPLEMEVAQEFREQGFRVGQGTYYQDPDTKEPREIDVVASLAGVTQDLQVFLTCFVACKLSRDKPWVLFTTDRTSQPDLFGRNPDLFNMVASRLGMKLLFALNRAGSSDPLPRALTPPDRLAYGITVGLRKGSAVDIAYGAVMSAAKAAVSRAATVRAEYEGEDAVVEVMVPTVLIDGLLFEYYLEEDGSKRLRKTNWGLLSLGNPIPGRNQSTLVYVVTKEGLAEFVKSLSELFAYLQKGSKELHDKLIQFWYSSRPTPQITVLPLAPRG